MHRRHRSIVRHLSGTTGCALIQSLQPADSTEGPNVGKAEREAITVLLADGGGKGIARILEGDAAAVPVVVGLYGCRLDVIEPVIHAHGCRATQSEERQVGKEGRS